MAETAGTALPPVLQLAERPRAARAVRRCFAIGDALVFALFAWFARRYWIGLLFVPPILYLAGAFGALWVFAAQRSRRRADAPRICYTPVE